MGFMGAKRAGSRTKTRATWGQSLPLYKTEKPGFNPASPTHSTTRTLNSFSSPAKDHRQHAIRLPETAFPASHQYWGQTGEQVLNPS